MAQVLVNENVLFSLKQCAMKVAKEHPEDGDLCWCLMTIPKDQLCGLHTGLCHQLRGFFGIEEEK